MDDLKNGKLPQTHHSLTNGETHFTTDTNVASEAMRQTKRRKMLQVGLLLFSLFVSLSGYAMLSPFFPQMAEKKGLSQFEIGFIFALFPAIVFVTAPIYGSVVTKLTPKFMCVSGCFVCGGSVILFGLLNYVTNKKAFLSIALAIRAVQGNGGSMLNVAACSLAMKSFPDKTGIMSSLIESAVGMGYIAGPALGAAFYALSGYTLPFLVVGSFTLATSLLLLIFLDRLDDVEPQTHNFFKLFKIPGCVVMFVQFFISTLASSFLDPVLSPWITSTFSVSASVAGLIFAAWSTTYSIATLVSGKIVDKGYIYSSMITGIIGCGVTYFFMAPTPLFDFIFHGKHYLWLVVLTSVLEGIFQAIMYVPGYQATLNILEVYGYQLNIHTYGLAAGMMTSGYSLGSAAGPLLSGYLTQKLTFKWALFVIALILLAMSVVHFVYIGVLKMKGIPLALNRDIEATDDETKPLLA